MRASRRPGRLSGLVLTAVAGGLGLCAGLRAEEPGIGPEAPSAFYRRYAQALQAAAATQRAEPLRAMVSDRSADELERLERLEGEERRLAFAVLGAGLPEELAVIAEHVEGDRALLQVEGFEPADSVLQLEPTGEPPPGYRVRARPPIRRRHYASVFLVREGGTWRVDRQQIVLYHDPRAYFERVDGPEWDELGLQYHCNRTWDERACEAHDPTVHPLADACWACYAQLLRDRSLCERVAEDLAAANPSLFADQIAFRRASCQLDVAGLTGDPAICERLPDREILGRNARASCRERIAGHDFLASTNVFQLDSDRDGLTDLQEAYFNTSIGSPDTDGDGTTDYEEIMELTNPLGTGRLGDHLRATGSAGAAAPPDARAEP